MMLKPALRPPLRAPLRGATTLREGVGVWWLPAAPAIPVPTGGSIYISDGTKTLPLGDDTTGTGSAAAPYRSLSKAMSVIAAAGNKYVECDGTFPENTGAGGRWIPNAPFLAPVVIRSYSGLPDNFIISNLSGTAGVVGPRLYAVSNLWVVGATIRPTTDTHSILYQPLDSSHVVAGMTFADCVVEVRTNAGTGFSGFFAATDLALSGLQLLRCVLKRVAGTSTTVNPTGLNIVPATVSSAAFQPFSNIKAMYCSTSDAQWVASSYPLAGIDGLDIIGNTYSCSTYGIAVGKDQSGGTTPKVTGARIWGNTLSTLAAAGHGILVGENVTGADVAKNAVTSQLQGIVVKGASNTNVRQNSVALVNSVNGTALYPKASTDTAFTDNNVTVSGTGAGTGFREGIDIANKAGNTTLLRNVIDVSGPSAVAINWGGSSESTGGATSDYNSYILRNGASLGFVRGQAVTTLAELQAAWPLYGLAGDNPLNDAHSTVTVIP